VAVFVTGKCVWIGFFSCGCPRRIFAGVVVSQQWFWILQTNACELPSSLLLVYQCNYVIKSHLGWN